MATWPSTLPKPDYGGQGKTTKAQIRTDFGAGYVQSRPRHTRGRRTWPLAWKRMPVADFAVLEAFFLTNQGGLFTYPDPATGASYTCRFSGDDLTWSRSGPNHMSVSIDIEEA